MKKLMTALAVCAAASISLAAAGVTSANMVGYQQQTLNAGNNLVGANWLAVGDAYSGTVKINEFLADPNGTVFYGTNNAALADQLKVWNGSTYVNYYFFKKTTGTVVGWCKGSATTATTDTMPLASGFWILKKGLPGTTASLAGEVPSASSVAQTVNTGNNLLSSGYPVAELINSTNFNWTSICYGTNNAAFADQLKVWNGSTYVNYYFFKKTTGTVVGWCKGSATTATTDTIPVGSAFWYLRKAVDSTTLTQNKPF